MNSFLDPSAMQKDKGFVTFDIPTSRVETTLNKIKIKEKQKKANSDLELWAWLKTFILGPGLDDTRFTHRYLRFSRNV